VVTGGWKEENQGQHAFGKIFTHTLVFNQH